MKKYLIKLIIFAFFMSGATLSVSPNTAQAADAWVYGVKDQYNVYVMTETVSHFGPANYSVNVKFVSANGNYDIHLFKFFRQGGRFSSSYVCSVDDGNSTPVSAESNIVAYRVFRYCNEHSL